MAVVAVCAVIIHKGGWKSWRFGPQNIFDPPFLESYIFLIPLFSVLHFFDPPPILQLKEV